MLRPLLLHQKPSAFHVSHLMDNAENLNVLRRVYRRQIANLKVSIDRIRQLYNQSIAIDDFFKQRFPYNVFVTLPDVAIQRSLDYQDCRPSLKTATLIRTNLLQAERRQAEKKKGFPLRVRIGNVVLFAKTPESELEIVKLVEGASVVMEGV